MTQTNDLTPGKLALRPFGEKDFEPLALLVGRTWLGDFPTRAQEAAGRIELAHYLARSTWGLVAERAGELMGAVLLAERGAEVLPGDWRGLERALTAAAEKDPELAEAVRVEMDGVAEEAAVEREYGDGGAPGTDATVKLLIVSPDSKGLGIGGRLFSAAEGHLREHGARGYHLLTDDACDVGFYEHRGLSRAMRHRSGAHWPGVDPATDEFYVYVYEREL